MATRRVVDAARLWTGGLLAGVVAAGVAPDPELPYGPAPYGLSY